MDLCLKVNGKKYHDYYTINQKSYLKDLSEVNISFALFCFLSVSLCKYICCNSLLGLTFLLFFFFFVLN